MYSSIHLALHDDDLLILKVLLMEVSVMLLSSGFLGMETKFGD